MDGCPIKMPLFNGNFPARSCRVQTRDLVMLTWTTSQAPSWRLGLVIDGILMDSIWSRDNWSRGWGAKSPGVVGCDTSWVWSTTGFWDTVVHFQTNPYYPLWEPLEWTFIKASGLDFELAEKPTSAENVDIGYSRNSKFVAAWFQGRLCSCQLGQCYVWYCTADWLHDMNLIFTVHRCTANTRANKELAQKKCDEQSAVLPEVSSKVEKAASYRWNSLD